MFKKFISFVLVLGLLCSLAGCGDVAGEIAGNVAEAAKKELENQVKATFEKYKIEILDLKTAVGKLNGESEDVQFFCAVLVSSDSDAIPQSAADTLSKLFHDRAGTSPSRYLTDLRMQKAKKLLLDSQLSIREIAERVGYPDPFHFSKSFKNAVGMSPAQFRERREGG